MKRASRQGMAVIFAVMFNILIAGCGSKAGQATATLIPEIVQTQAVATFAAGLTQTAAAMPTSTPTATASPSPTLTSTPTATGTAATPVTLIITPASSCNGMAFVSDVTVPDNTNMNPGQKFTKTWKVRNNGSCAWDVGYQLRFVGGEAMGGSAFKLEKSVSPGTETELSVSLTAPNTAGTYRGNWRMSTAAGAYFGDEIYVLIVVGGTPVPTTSVTATVMATTAVAATFTGTASPTATQTPTPTETAVPES